jgi:hypothetical protein
VGPALVALLLVTAAQSRAQDLEILDRGKPVAGVPVTAGGQPVGTTSPNGTISFDPNMMNLTKGETVEVWVRDCGDGRVEIVLAPEGSDDPCIEEGAQAGERCGCRRIGAFIVGDGPVTIDIGNGTVTQASGGGAARTGSSWVIGLGFDLRQMLNLEDVLAEVPGGSDESATSWAPGAQIFGEYNYGKLFSLGVDAAYSRMDTEIRFAEGVQTGDLAYYEVGVNAKLGIPTRGRIWPYATVGLYRTWNEGDFERDGLSENRSHATRRDGLGAGFDYDAGPNWGLRFEGLYSSTFEDGDADEHIRWKFGFLYRPGGYGYVMQDQGGLHE